MPSRAALARLLFASLFVCSVLTFAVFRSGLASRSAEKGPTALVPIISATKTVTDVAGTIDGNADPGDTLEYTVTINNTGADPATNLSMSDALAGPQTLVAGSLLLSPIAVNDTYAAIGNVGITVPDGASDLLGNDLNPGGGTLAIVAPVPTTSANGGNVTINTATGDFTYNPPPGFEGADTFTYTLGNGSGLTNTATVTINVAGMVWFIDNSGANGDGRLGTPFNSLANFNAGAADGTGDNIFLYRQSATDYVGPITLLNNQKLIGQGATATLVAISGVTVPPFSNALPATGGTNPNITSATVGITLGQGNTIRGLNVGNVGTAAGNAKIFGNNFGTLTVGSTGGPDVALTGTGQALNLTTGTFAATSQFNGVTTTSSVGQGISLAGVAGTVAFGSTTVSGNPTQCILVGTSTANINFGNTSCTGGTDGISLQNNSAGTRTLGAITTTNGSGDAFLHAVGGGTTTITGATSITNPGGNCIDIQDSTTAVSFQNVTCNASAQVGVFLDDNTGAVSFADLDIDTDPNVRAFHALSDNTGAITTTSGTIADTGTATAVEVIGTSAASRTPLNMQLTSVSANGAASGIVLTNTSSTGSPGGFTILGNAGACTSAATCTGGSILNTTGSSVALTNATKIAFTRLFIGNSSSHGINANAVNGALSTNGLTLTSCFVDDSGDADNEYGMNLVNLTNTVTIDGTTFNGAADNLVYVNHTGALTFNVSNSSSFSYPASVSGTANSAILIEPSGSGAATASIQNSTFTNIVSASAQIGSNTLNANGTHSFNFSNNTINVTLPARGSGVVVSGQELTTTNITINNNVFSGAGGNGVISIDTNDTSTVRGTANSNTITNPPGIGMFVAVDEGGKNDITLNGNTITNSGGDGIQTVNFGGTGVSTMDLAITNNQVNGHSLNTAVNFVGGIASFALSAPPDAGDSICLAHRGNTVTGTPASGTQCGGAPCDDHHFEEVAGQMTYEEIPNTGATTLNAAYVNSINDAGPVNVFGFIDLTNGAACNIVPRSAEGGIDNDVPAASSEDQPIILPSGSPKAQELMQRRMIQILERRPKLPAVISSISEPVIDFHDRSDLFGTERTFAKAVGWPSAADTALANPSTPAALARESIAHLGDCADFSRNEVTPDANEVKPTRRVSDYWSKMIEIAVRIGGTVSPTAHAQDKKRPEASAPETGETVTTPAFTLPAGETITVRFRATVDNGPYASGLNAITNTANITADGGINVNSTQSSINLDAAPDLVVTKTDGGGTTQPGVPVVYTLSYSNATANNGQHAANVVLTETVPANTTFNAANSTAGWSCPDLSPAATVCTFNVGAVNAGAAAVNVNFAVNVLGALPAGVTQVSNTSSIAENPNVNGTDLNAANNTGPDTTNIIGNWLGGTSTDWFTASNWSNNTVPPSGNNVSIPAGGNVPTLSGADATVNNLVLNGQNLFILAGRTVTVNGTISLGINSVDGAGTLALPVGAAITRTSGQVNSTLLKSFAAPGSFTYPVGTPGAYTPVTANVTAGSGDLSVRANAGTAPATPPINDATSLDRYWTLAETGDLTADLLFTYLQADVDGNENGYRVIRVNTLDQAVGFPNAAPCPGVGSPCVDPGANTIRFNGVQVFAAFWTAGEAAPTAANARVTGRVLTGDGRGLGGSIVAIVDGAGNVRYAMTNPFGYYRFNEVRAGESYVVSVRDKRFAFASRVVNVNDSFVEVNFVPEE